MSSMIRTKVGWTEEARQAALEARRLQAAGKKPSEGRRARFVPGVGYAVAGRRSRADIRAGAERAGAEMIRGTKTEELRRIVAVADKVTGGEFVDPAEFRKHQYEIVNAASAKRELDRRAKEETVVPAKYPQEQTGLPGMKPPKASGAPGRRTRSKELLSMNRKYVFGRAAMDGEPPLSAERVSGGRNPDGSIRLPTRRPPDTRPGMVPLGGRDPRDPYQVIGQPRPLPRMMTGPMRTVPPNWPARAVDNEVGRAAYPGSQEPVRLSGPRQPQGGFLTAGEELVQSVTEFSSHYGEGRQPKVPAWRYGV